MVLVKWERQTKSSLTNITSDQYCRPFVWEGVWADDYQQLPQPASVQQKMHIRTNTHRYTYTHSDTEALKKSTHTQI